MGQASKFQKNIYFYFVWITVKQTVEILKEMRVPDHPVCLLRKLYVGQKATEPYMEQLAGLKLGKEYNKVVYCHLFYFYAEHILGNVRLDESQARIKISKRNINNLRHADDTTLMAESEKELKSFLMV